MKRKWLQYHARKTEGVLSLCPCCHGMPMRVWFELVRQNHWNIAPSRLGLLGTISIASLQGPMELRGPMSVASLQGPRGPMGLNEGA